MTDKYVCIFPDYMATGLWSRDGISMYLDLNEMPLSPELVEELNLMNAAYDRDDSEYMDNVFEQHDYTYWSYKIALKIKKELPDWEVAFLNKNNELGLNLKVNNSRSILS